MDLGKALSKLALICSSLDQVDFPGYQSLLIITTKLSSSDVLFHFDYEQGLTHGRNLWLGRTDREVTVYWLLSESTSSSHTGIYIMATLVRSCTMVRAEIDCPTLLICRTSFWQPMTLVSQTLRWEAPFVRENDFALFRTKIRLQFILRAIVLLMQFGILYSESTLQGLYRCFSTAIVLPMVCYGNSISEHTWWSWCTTELHRCRAVYRQTHVWFLDYTSRSEQSYLR